ncbi:MAG: ribulose-phosphate 3-epimerase [Bacteroidota bacterium]
MSHIIAPSVLSADFGNLQRDVEMINKSEADWFHVDVMDGMFVPNISFGFPVMKAIKKHAEKPLDVHLMVMDPDRYLKAFKDAGADILTVHYEGCTHLHRTVQAIKALGMNAGVAINPHTSVNLLVDIMEHLDVVLVMSVNPGFGGQKFIENTYHKIVGVRDIIRATKSAAIIEVDGGVDLNNYTKLLEAGATALVAGNTVFSSANPMQTIADLKKC